MGNKETVGPASVVGNRDTRSHSTYLCYRFYGDKLRGVSPTRDSEGDEQRRPRPKKSQMGEKAGC